MGRDQLEMHEGGARPCSSYMLVYLRNYEEANSKTDSSQKQTTNRRINSPNEVWSPPPRGCWKINVDAAWSDHLSVMGIGIVCRDSDGAIIEASSFSSDLIPEAPGAELKAILMGVRRAIDLGCGSIILESDCQVAINFLTKASEVWCNVEGLVEEIWALENGLRYIRYQYVSRKGNKVADSLAKRAKLSNCSESWVDYFPDWLCLLVENDRSSFAQVAV